MTNQLTWKKRLVSLLVLAFVGAAALPALADGTTGQQSKVPDQAVSDRKDNPRPPSCRTVCNFDSKGNAIGCHQVCS